MTIEQLYEMLEKIPKYGIINIARRNIIMQKIAEIERGESK